jgi:hypothetical protein
MRDRMPQDRNGAAKTATDLETKLSQLLGDDALALIDLQLPDQVNGSEAQKKHNARTARYKKSRALNLTPDSEAVAQACSYILLGVMSRGGKSSGDTLIRIMKELIAAGYDQEESRTSIIRLLTDVDARKSNWRLRTRQRLARQVTEALRRARSNE